jgi:hypothetical protein
MQDFDPPLALRTTTWDRPTVKFDPDPSVPPVPSGTEVTVKNSILEEIALGSGPATMGVSRVLSAAPLWDDTPAALKPPTGCTGAGAATSFAAPLHEDISPTHSEVLPSDDNHFPKAAKVTWTRLVNTTLSAFFRTYCVVFNTDGTKRFSALRQTVWTLDVDSSGPRAKQRAVVEDDEDATFDPAPPPPQTDPTFITRYRQVGDDTILFRK